MTPGFKKQQGEFEKQTFRAVNDSYLLFGVIDWRYGVAATILAVILGVIGHSYRVGVIAWIVFQIVAYRIYSRDAVAPLVWIFSLMDKKHSCPFKQ